MGGCGSAGDAKVEEAFSGHPQPTEKQRGCNAKQRSHGPPVIMEVCTEHPESRGGGRCQRKEQRVDNRARG